jgi:transposase-like protein
LHKICEELQISLPKLTAEFDKIKVAEGVQIPALNHAINLLIDAVFFGHDYGYLCFHDTHQIIYFCEIKTETTADLRQALIDLKKAGFKIKSVTIDGRRGSFNAIRRILGKVPIQMCLFHQKAIIRRYIGQNPTTICAQELKELMQNLCHIEGQIFINSFYELEAKYESFLNEKNSQGNFAHSALRSAFRSVKTNLPYLFTFQDIPLLKIPPTNNHLEGCFSHLKEKIRVHRGLQKNRKKNAIKFILKHFNNHPK